MPVFLFGEVSHYNRVKSSLLEDSLETERNVLGHKKDTNIVTFDTIRIIRIPKMTYNSFLP